MSSRALTLVKNIRPLTIPNASSTKSLRVMVIGGSIGGLATAVALSKAGAKVKVFEGHQTKLGGGSGLGIDSVSIGILKGLGVDFEGLYSEELAPLPMEKYLDQSGRYLYQRNDLPLFSCYWQDVYNMLLEQVPSKAMIFDRELTDLDCEGEDGRITVTFQDGDTISGDFLVGADGVMSRVREKALGPLPLRYSGYSAWRGCVGPEDVEPEVMDKFRDAFPDLGLCHYYELGKKEHSAFFELGGGFINWNIFLHSDNPNAEPGKVTSIPDEELLSKLKQDTNGRISDVFGGLVASTKHPFLHDIYDADPVKTFVNRLKNVALVGDAAHPTTPHALRGANMTIQDAYVLGKCLSANQLDLGHALDQYNEVRVPEAARSVYLARHLGRVKNGLHDFAADFEKMGSEDFASSYYASGVSMALLPDHPIFNPSFDSTYYNCIPVVGLNHIARETENVEELTQFYMDMFGFEICERPKFEFGGTWLKLHDHLVLHIIEKDPLSTLRKGPASTPADAAVKTEEAFIRRGHHLAFRVFNIERAKQILKDKGIPFSTSIVPNSDTKQLFFFDPDGNGIEIGSFPSSLPPKMDRDLI